MPNCALTSGVFLGISILASGQVNVTTYHNDNSRTGQNLQESALTPANVNAGQFGKLFARAVDGYIYAQPLYLSGITISGQKHNVIIVATEHDSVYAFDADNKSSVNPLWKTSFLNPPAVTTVSSSTDAGCGDLVPEIGITSTPVIDLATQTIYVVAKTKESGKFFQRLHALDVTNGSEKFGGPVIIQASMAGTGDGNSGGIVIFDPLKEHQRAGLLLNNGLIYIGWASHCDIGPYHGWVMAYNSSTLSQVGFWNSTPDGGLGGVWQGGAGLAADSNGVYIATGNGTFDWSTGGRELGDSVVRLGSPSAGLIPVLDYFTPFNQGSLNGGDVDLDSGGTLLLPDLPSGSAHTHLIAQAGKEGRIYLLDRDALGGYSTSADGVVQELPGAIGGVWGMPAYWNNTVYFGGSYDTLKAFSFNSGGSGLLSASPVSSTTRSFAFPGPTPSISANGAGNGILWAIQSDAYGSHGQAILHAFDATNLATELYNSQTNTNDAPGPAVKFSVPTIANGKVYVGTANQLAVYGALQPAAAVPSFSPPGAVYTTGQTVTLTSATAGAAIHFTRDGSTPTVHSPLYTAPFKVATTGTVKALATAAGLRASSVATALYTLQTTPGTGPNYLGGFTAQGLTLNGSAQISTTRLRLTDGNFGEAASAFFTTPVNSNYFASDFTFQLTNPSADGITFCIQNVGPSALGLGGGDLGYTQIGISSAVKFDLYNNAGEGVNSTGLYTNGQAPSVPAVDLTPSGIDLHSGHVFRARLIYYKPFLTLDIVDNADFTKSFSNQFVVDIPSTVGGDSAYVGFTGGTGGLSAIQEIVTWDELSYPGKVAALPTFTPSAGTYTGSQTVTISDSTTGSSIFYTTDGTTPTPSSTKYSGPISVSANSTVKALATAPGFLKSSVASATYVIQ